MPIDQDTKHIDQTESGFQSETGLQRESALQQEYGLQPASVLQQESSRRANGSQQQSDSNQVASQQLAFLEQARQLVRQRYICTEIFYTVINRCKITRILRIFFLDIVLCTSYCKHTVVKIIKISRQIGFCKNYS